MASNEDASSQTNTPASPKTSDVDCARWQRAEIISAIADLKQTLARQQPGPYQLQASIAALHAEAIHAADTDWKQIAALYAALLKQQPTAIVQLNAAVACAFAYGFAHGLAWMERLAASGELAGYHLLPPPKPNCSAASDALLKPWRITIKPSPSSAHPASAPTSPAAGRN